jgi:hypothetical protein
MNAAQQVQEAIHCMRGHWPEYLMETGELAGYMFSTCLFELCYSTQLRRSGRSFTTTSQGGR